VFTRQEAIDLYNRGCAAMAAGRYDDATSLFRQSLTVEPGVAMAGFNLAFSLQRAGDLAGAIAAYRRCAADNPGHAESLYNLGCALELAGDTTAAIEAYRTCLLRNPGHRDSVFNLAASLQQIGDLRGAIEAYRACLSRHPADADVAYNLACLLQQTGDPAAAIALYRTSLAHDPGHRASAFNLAGCLEAAGDRRGAVTAYRTCIAHHPDHPDATINLGSLLRKGGDLAGAIALYRKYLAHHPGHRESLFDLASCLQEAGDEPAAIACYRDSMVHHPDHPDALDNLTNLLMGQGAYDEAVRILDEFCARHPEHRHLTINLALARWRGRMASGASRERDADAIRLLVACMPKSGSTYLADVLSRLPGMQRAHLVPDYGRREQELDLEQLINHAGMSYVSQLHLRPSKLTLELMAAFGLKAVFLFRNIWDVMSSLRDHMHSHSLEWSMAQIDPAFREWDEGRQYEFLARAMMPWFIDFYVGWMRHGDRLAVRYEDLMAEPAATVGRIAAWAGISASAEEIGRALGETGRSATFNKGGSGRGQAVPAAARAHVEALAAFYPDVDFAPLMGPR
jgi:tetratricopeptide (TPR) repeat protein